MFRVLCILVFTINVMPISNSPLNVGISGGDSTTIEDRPWMVSVLIRKLQNYLCGGFLISPSWAVTGAQCLSADDYGYAIRVGSNTSFSSGEGVYIDVEAIIHPYFNSTNSWDHDIALLHLTAPVSDDIQSLALPESDETIPVGALVDVIGWGEMDPWQEIYPTSLREASMPIISNDECSEKYNDFTTVSDNMICGGYSELDGNGPCKGDTGGPAVLNGKAVGIVSWFIYCSTPDYPAIFTKLPNYVDWIHNVTGVY